MKTLSDLENYIGIIFKNKNILKQAFIHSTYAYEAGGEIESNERLEFVGDAVLGLIVTEYMHGICSGSESELHELRKTFINNLHLSKVSDELDLDALLLKGKGESENEKGKDTRIANALEALIGAIFIDQGENGYKKAKEFVYKYFKIHELQA